MSSFTLLCSFLSTLALASSQNSPVAYNSYSSSAYLSSLPTTDTFYSPANTVPKNNAESYIPTSPLTAPPSTCACTSTSAGTTTLLQTVFVNSTSTSYTTLQLTASTTVPGTSTTTIPYTLTTGRATDIVTTGITTTQSVTTYASSLSIIIISSVSGSATATTTNYVATSSSIITSTITVTSVLNPVSTRTLFQSTGVSRLPKGMRHELS